MSPSSATGVAREASNNDALETIARVGYAVTGVLHILIGAIAIGVATGAGGEADQSGAIHKLASAPGGSIILWVVVVGLAALGIWQLISGVAHWGQLTKVLSAFGQGVVYLVVAVTALTFALGGSKSTDTSTKSFSAKLLSTPGGTVLLVLIGVGIFAGGVYFVYLGISLKFRKQIRVPLGDSGDAVLAFGRVGYIAKGIAIGVVGILFVIAAFTSDAKKASGLDGALKSLKELPYGPIILIVVGVGVIAYGLYCFARARLAKL
jgi:hypothetical protein